MSKRMTETAKLVFEQLTSRTFYVIDTEYTAATDVFGGNRLISIAIVPVVAGRRAPASQEFYREMNPRTAISAESTRIHGFTDKSVARKREFAFHAADILSALGDTEAVLVSHTNVDVHVLRGELLRLDDRRSQGDAVATKGLDDLPELSLLDTSTLPRRLKLPGIGNSGVVSLAKLCELTGISNTKAHNALTDARATADALIRLLEHAANTGTFWDIDELLQAHRGGSTLDPRGPAHITTERSIDPELPPAHIAKHSAPLLEKATESEVKEWLELAKECATLRCQWLIDETSAAGNLNADKLIDPLMEQLTQLTEPGQAGTLLGAVQELVDHEPRDGKPGMAYTRAARWWGQVREYIENSTACATTLEEQCPSCRAHEPCPRDVIHQAVARAAFLGKPGGLSGPKAAVALKGGKGVDRWPKESHRLRGYASWLAIANQEERGKDSKAASLLTRAMQTDLHLFEPRLTLLACDVIGTSKGAQAAVDLAERVLANRTSDPGFDDLAAWVNWIRQTETASVRKAARKPTQFSRLARPEGRTNPNPYAIEPGP